MHPLNNPQQALIAHPASREQDRRGPSRRDAIKMMVVSSVSFAIGCSRSSKKNSGESDSAKQPEEAAPEKKPPVKVRISFPENLNPEVQKKLKENFDSALTFVRFDDNTEDALRNQEINISIVNDLREVEPSTPELMQSATAAGANDEGGIDYLVFIEQRELNDGAGLARFISLELQTILHRQNLIRTQQQNSPQSTATELVKNTVPYAMAANDTINQNAYESNIRSFQKLQKLSQADPDTYPPATVDYWKQATDWKKMIASGHSVREREAEQKNKKE